MNLHPASRIFFLFMEQKNQIEEERQKQAEIKNDKKMASSKFHNES